MQQAVAEVLDNLPRYRQQLQTLMTERFHLTPVASTIVVGVAEAKKKSACSAVAFGLQPATLFTSKAHAALKRYFMTESGWAEKLEAPLYSQLYATGPQRVRLPVCRSAGPFLWWEVPALLGQT
jgi:hypothetical protein